MTKLEQIDARIKEVESTLVYLLHERLALVKSEPCKHEFSTHKYPFHNETYKMCSKCRKVEQ